MLEPKLYVFYGLPKFEKGDVSFEDLAKKWKTGQAAKIEYIPFEQGRFTNYTSSYDYRYVLLKTSGGEEKVFFYWTKDKERFEYSVSNEQWHGILAATLFSEIRFFFTSNEVPKALAFRCGTDWDNTNLLNHYITDKIPLR